MLRNFEYSFSINGGRRIFLPTLQCRNFGERLHARVLRRWTPPDYFFHFQSGGHVAAAREHVCSRLFVLLDLQHFYGSITRTKIHRALRICGFKHKFAWEAACESTVSLTGSGGPFVLPFGFIQSPVLASLVLSVSHLGRALAAIHHGTLRVSVYMDDIIISGDNVPALEVAKSDLEKAARQSGFVFNPLKTFGPDAHLDVFNLSLSHNCLEVSSTRLADFATALRNSGAATTSGILGYVGSVNVAQYSTLAANTITLTK
jgi:hypothetical protein